MSELSVLKEEIKALEGQIGVCYGPPALAPEVKIELLKLKIELFKCQQMESIQTGLFSIELSLRRLSNGR
jgi:hypothetical protein